ncbi:PCTP-like protein [Arapaima gigas]
MSGVIPDDAVFADFRRQCLSTENWLKKYEKNDMEVWIETPSVTENNRNHGSKVQKIKCRMVIRDVSAATMYDVLHDSQGYREKRGGAWGGGVSLCGHCDTSFSGLCPKPLKNRDVVTLRSWLVMDDEYLIVNYSVKHPKYPPRKDLVRAVSIITGYMVKATGPNSCTFTYLSQADPKGSLPKWVVNKASQVVAPKVLKCVHKAGQNYPQWKKQNFPDRKPWLYPEQNNLPQMDPSELVIQRGDSLENVDESSSRDPREDEASEDSS